MHPSNEYIYGFHAITARLNQGGSIDVLYVKEKTKNSRLDQLLKLAKDSQVPVKYLSQESIDKQFSEYSHQGVIASIEKRQDYTESNLPELLKRLDTPPLILILDGVTDPHNLGACLRTADAAGVHCVIVPKDNSASITPTVSKIACGAVESVPLVRVTNLVRTMNALKKLGVWIYGADERAADSVYNLECQSPMAIVLGAEGHGLRRLTQETCDGVFSLPMLGTVESLNVSVATGVCLYEVVRQRHVK